MIKALAAARERAGLAPSSKLSIHRSEGGLYAFSCTGQNGKKLVAKVGPLPWNPEPLGHYQVVTSGVYFTVWETFG